MPSTRFLYFDMNRAWLEWNHLSAQHPFRGVTEDTVLECVLRVLQRRLRIATASRRMPANLIPVAREITQMLMHGGSQRLGAPSSRPQNGSPKQLDDTLRLIDTLRR